MSHFPDQLILKNVPRVHFFDGTARCPEDIPFPSVMRALLEYFNNEEIGCKFCSTKQKLNAIRCRYAFLIGVSGIASFLNWKPGWEEDNAGIMYMSDNPEAPFTRAFEAIGYTYQIYGKQQDYDLFKKAIITSINSGNPVIAFGPIGPPEAALITGYAEAGEVLIGWNFFQNFPVFNNNAEFEPTGEFRKRKWMNYEPGFSFIVIGEKAQQPQLNQIYRQSFQWMIQVARTPVTFGERSNGFAAYNAWAAQLTLDNEFPNSADVKMQRYEVHNNVVGFLAEARWYGSLFLSNLAEQADTIIHRDAIEDVLHAAALFAGEHELMWKLWDLTGGIGNPDGWQLFAERDVRAQMAQIIHKARQKDEQAIMHIESALEKKW